MRTLLHYRIILWLTALSVGPALILDLFAVGSGAGGVWSVFMVLALWLGAPYYSAQLALGLAVGSPNSAPSDMLRVAAALLVIGAGVAAHTGLAWCSRRARTASGA